MLAAKGQLREKSPFEILKPNFPSSFLESHQVLAQLLDTLLAIGTKLPENQAIQMRLVDVACKVRI